MSLIADIINTTSHRPWPLPKGRWQYYQEWNEALFCHYSVPTDLLESLLPKHLELDLYEGQAWVSVVAFKMERIRPRHLPPLSFISNFEEINVRTYVTRDGKAGVYFLNIEAEKLLSAIVAKRLSGLPYEKVDMRRLYRGNAIHFTSTNRRKGHHLKPSLKSARSVKRSRNWTAG